MPLARLTTLIVALTVLVAADSGAAGWSAPATLRTCAPASDPRVVFPFNLPSHRSGHGAILWLGGTPGCSGSAAGAGGTLDAATLHSDDQPSVPRALVAGSHLVGPLAAASTAVGQLVAIAGDADSLVGGTPGALLAEGVAGGTLHRLLALGGPDTLVATSDGYIGDADVASTATLGGHQLIELRAQRHFDHSFTLLAKLDEGSAPITALAVGMDFRSDAIVLWAQGGEVHAQWVQQSGQVFPPQVLGPAGYAPQLAGVLSDNNHAFVMWTDEPAPGAAGQATIYLEHSGNNVVFARTPRTLLSFSEPAGQRLTPGSIALVRQTPSEGVLAAWTFIQGANFVVQAAGLTANAVLPATTIALANTDVRLAALTTGPHDDFVAVLETAPRAASGFSTSQQAILATRSVPGGPGGVAFAAPTQLAPPGPNSAPAVAVDPDSDSAVVAWQTVVGGTATIAYAVRPGA